MKRLNGWHLGCLANRIASLNREIRHRDELIKQVERDQKGIAFYRQQIVKAQHEGRDGFDEDKFLHKKVKDKA